MLGVLISKQQSLIEQPFLNWYNPTNKQHAGHRTMVKCVPGHSSKNQAKVKESSSVHTWVFVFIYSRSLSLCRATNAANAFFSQEQNRNLASKCWLKFSLFLHRWLERIWQLFDRQLRSSPVAVAQVVEFWTMNLRVGGSYLAMCRAQSSSSIPKSQLENWWVNIEFSRYQNYVL